MDIPEYIDSAKKDDNSPTLNRIYEVLLEENKKLVNEVEKYLKK